jgi:hypothetical protein
MALTTLHVALADPDWQIQNAPDHRAPALLHLPATEKLIGKKPGDRVSIQDENGKPVIGQLELVHPGKADLKVIALLPPGAGQSLQIQNVDAPSNTSRYSTTHASDGRITLQNAGKTIAVYRLDIRPLPGHEKYNQCNFFHPLQTPSGTIVTDDAPSDHLHHRGLFLTFTKVIGPGKDGKPVQVDFWHPHARSRVASGQLHYMRNGDVAATFAATHDFMIDDQPVITQTVTAAAVQLSDKVNVLDLTIELSAVTDGVTLGDNFYSGLQLRGSREYQRPQLMFTYADGKEHRDVDDHKEHPPKDRWFDMTGLIGKRLAGSAIAPHPETPASRLCYARGVKGINADFVYDEAIPLKKGQTLTCKYQIYLHDDHVEAAHISDLAAWYNPGPQIVAK